MNGGCCCWCIGWDEREKSCNFRVKLEGEAVSSYTVASVPCSAILGNVKSRDSFNFLFFVCARAHPATLLCGAPSEVCTYYSFGPVSACYELNVPRGGPCSPTDPSLLPLTDLPSDASSSSTVLHLLCFSPCVIYPWLSFGCLSVSELVLTLTEEKERSG